MQGNLIFVVVVLLVFSTSFNLARCSVGQHFESARGGQKIKVNDRRSAGLVPYPRIGRNSDSASFSRLDRALGMVHYPRIGRSDVSSFGNLNRFNDLSPEADIELYAVRDMDPDALLEADYEEYSSRPMAFKHADKMQKNSFWLMPDHVHGYKDLRSAQKIDDSRLYFLRADSRNTQGQGGYIPKSGRENEHEATNFF